MILFFELVVDDGFLSRTAVQHIKQNARKETTTRKYGGDSIGEFYEIFAEQKKIETPKPVFAGLWPCFLHAIAMAVARPRISVREVTIPSHCLADQNLKGQNMKHLCIFNLNVVPPSLCHTS